MRAASRWIGKKAHVTMILTTLVLLMDHGMSFADQKRCTPEETSRAEAYLKKGAALEDDYRANLEDARKLFLKAVQSCPTHYGSRAALLRVSMEMRDWQTASSLVASLLEEDPNDTAALMGKGALLIVEGETDRGIEVLKTIIGRLEDRGDLAAVYSNMGIASRIQGKYPAAIEYYRQSLAYRDKPVVLLNLAVAYEKSGSKLKAKECFEAFVDRYPDHPQKALVVERLRRY